MWLAGTSLGDGAIGDVVKDIFINQDKTCEK